METVVISRCRRTRNARLFGTRTTLPQRGNGGIPLVIPLANRAGVAVSTAAEPDHDALEHRSDLAASAFFRRLDSDAIRRDHLRAAQRWVSG